MSDNTFSDSASCSTSPSTHPRNIYSPVDTSIIPRPSSEHALLALMERTGYNIVQENGQRKYGGPPPQWSGPRPPKGSEVFVGKLPRDLYEDELVPVFETVGRLYEVRLMMDFSGTNRGFAFVMYTCPFDAFLALKHLNNHEIRPGKYIGVIKSIDNCRLFVSGIPRMRSSDDLFAEMNRVTDGVKNVTLGPAIGKKDCSMAASLNPMLGRGKLCAFVEYKDHKSAAMARRKLVPGRVLISGQPITVDWATPEIDGVSGCLTADTMFVLRINDGGSYEFIADLNNFIHSTIAIGLLNARRIGAYVYLHYSSKETASVAFSKLNGVMIDNCKLDVCFAKLEERRPILRTAECEHTHTSGSHEKWTVCGDDDVSAVRLLDAVCFKNGWGMPVYRIEAIHDNISQQTLFSCKLTVYDQVFISPSYSNSASVARKIAVNIALDHLNISVSNKNYLPSNKSLHDFSNKYIINNSTDMFRDLSL